MYLIFSSSVVATETCTISILSEDRRDPDTLPPKTITGRLLRKTAPFFYLKSTQGSAKWYRFRRHVGPGRMSRHPGITATIRAFGR